ncbi:MAG: metal ABC transporter substrate-binding protein [Armatimonadota bacterium]|nr:metal ABC transporter substrate-binding protein [Armatimonadota bacterium]MDR5696328.1 metal ABC transporter substrate-binding protein [Armatimonadota bacterium]
MKRVAWLSAVLVAIVACAPARPEQRLSVVASFYPLYEFAQRIGGDRADVRLLVPPGAEPHDYEPTPQDVVALGQANLVIYNGAGFEPWIERLRGEISDRAVVVDATEGLPLVAAEHGHDHPGEERKEGPQKEALDPHVWLDPVLAQQQVDNILAGFVRADPEGEATYRANSKALRKDLQALHERLEQALADCRIREFITAHAAFGYFARRYRIKMIPIAGLSPEAEPSPGKLREIVREAREHGIQVIYYERLVSPRVAETIAREVGARTLVLDPVEGLTEEDRREGKTYFAVMDENLRNLVEGLECR